MAFVGTARGGRRTAGLGAGDSVAACSIRLCWPLFLLLPRLHSLGLWPGYIPVNGEGPPRQTTPREKGGWDPGTLDRVEFVSSLQHHHPATGRGENLRTEGEAATQGAAAGSGSSCWEQRLRTLPAAPPSAPLSAHGASDSPQHLSLTRKLWVFSAGGKKDDGPATPLPDPRQGSPLWSAAVLPGLPWPLCPRPFGPGCLCCSCCGLGWCPAPSETVKWLQAQPLLHPIPHLSRGN